MLSKEDEICVEDDCITVGAGMAAVKDSQTVLRSTGLTGMESLPVSRAESVVQLS